MEREHTGTKTFLLFRKSTRPSKVDLIPNTGSKRTAGQVLCYDMSHLGNRHVNSYILEFRVRKKKERKKKDGESIRAHDLSVSNYLSTPDERPRIY